ncbi:MAG TPA: efflux RND transporter periplasmic adaptor subunit [Candidatus Saccharimonadales bacterium]|nr:efflux RND transporter periplasmic adaptor subunit [Candidatus Saccharimonadales bacterium]
MTLRGRGLWIILAVAVAGFFLLRSALRTQPIAVETARTSIGVVEDLVANSEAGTVRSRAEARLGAERAGRVAAIPCREGTRVRGGEVLLRLDDTTARTRLAAALRDQEAMAAALQVARSAAALARQIHDRTRRLWEDHLASQEQMDKARAELERADGELHAAGARVASAAAAVRLARDEIDHLQVRSPFPGVVSRRLVEVGESVVPGQPVMEVLDPDRLYVSAPIDERDAGRLRQGLPARVTVDAYPGVIWTGQLVRVSPMVDYVKEQNRTLEVEVELPPAAGKPRPRQGMSADVEVILGNTRQALRVPSSAVIEGRRVLVLERGRAAARDVTVGLKNWEWTQIQSGLREGEEVITTLDRQGLRAGVPVKVAADRK